MIKLLNILFEDITDWEFGFDRNFQWDINSTENEGRFRLLPPDEIQQNSYYRSEKHPWTKEEVDGISYVLGKRKDNGKLAIQAIRFDKDIWNEDQAKEWFEENKRKFRFNIPRIDEGLNLVKKSWNREKLITYFEGVLDWFDPDFEDYMWGRFTRAILEKLHENYYYNYQNIDYYLTDEINKILKNDWIISEDPIKLLFKLYNPNEIIRTIIEFGEPGI